jgi:hypothetical protein
MAASATGTAPSMTGMPPEDHDSVAIEWLLQSAEPGIRMQTRRDLQGEDAADDEARVLDGPIVRRLLDGQHADGGFGTNVYAKWRGAHWRLASLVELGIPAGEPRALAAYETVLQWLLGPRHLAAVKQVAGRYRRCASQEGNALHVGVRLGLADDPRVAQLAANLVRWQWPAGGWNCDKRPPVTHPSFNESITPLLGLSEFARATGDGEAADAAHRAAEMFLEHRMFRSHSTGEIGNPTWMDLHWPPYWAYDMAWGLIVLGRGGYLPDPRADEAITRLRQMQGPDGSWSVQPHPRHRGNVDPAHWPRTGPSELLTLNLLRTL